MWQQKSSFDCIKTKALNFFSTYVQCTMYMASQNSCLPNIQGYVWIPGILAKVAQMVVVDNLAPGQLGTKILKTDNLAPRQENGQFSTRQFGTGKFLYFCICIFVICILFKRNHLTLSFFIPYLCPTGHTNTPKLNLCPRCCQKCFIKFNLVV